MTRVRDANGLKDKSKGTSRSLSKRERKDTPKHVHHPSHYTSHPSGVECIDIAMHFNMCLGNVIKYVWRAGLKNNNSKLQDLQKALQYLEFEIGRVKKHEEAARIDHK